VVVERVRACIVGAGFSGIAAGISLRRAGITDIRILERGASVGGAWRDNTYPGCACDVQSRLYELSVAPWADWSRRYSAQPEIKAYLQSVVEIFGLEPSLRLNCDMRAATWDDHGMCWRIETSTGLLLADSLISACGGLTEPFVPEVEGLADFTGAVMHSARWDHSVDMSGARVAVVGTGASAIQIVPALAPVVGELVLMQRTPAWIMPRRDRPIPQMWRRVLNAAPMIQQGMRELTSLAREMQLLAFTRQGVFTKAARAAALRHMDQQVSDAALRSRLTPDYEIGCKRILISDDFYPAVQRDNVTLTGALRRATPTGVVDEDGVEHPVDVIVLATGFRVLEPPLADRVVGRDGQRLSTVLADTGMAAYRGTTVTGFPNLFILQGPNTGLGHSSVVLMTESQVAYSVQAIASGDVVEPRRERQDDYVAKLDQRLATTVWQQGGCSSWYQNGHGRNVALWPGSTRAFARMMRRFDTAAYAVRRRQERAHAPSG
jgi:cation diffusion facilitator CzcD-associated flavoprotein CzcO